MLLLQNSIRKSLLNFSPKITYITKFTLELIVTRRLDVLTRSSKKLLSKSILNDSIILITRGKRLHMKNTATTHISIVASPISHLCNLESRCLSRFAFKICNKTEKKTNDNIHLEIKITYYILDSLIIYFINILGKCCHKVFNPRSLEFIYFYT